MLKVINEQFLSQLLDDCQFIIISHSPHIISYFNPSWSHVRMNRKEGLAVMLYWLFYIPLGSVGFAISCGNLFIGIMGTANHYLVRFPRVYGGSLCKHLSKKSETSKASGENQNVEYPNIVVIMNEAFLDLRVLGELETTAEVMPYWDAVCQGLSMAAMTLTSVPVNIGENIPGTIKVLAADM